MSKISTNCGKSQTFTIEGIELEFKSSYLTIDDLPALMLLSENVEGSSIEEKKIKGQVISDLVFKVLKKADPDATDEEIKEFGLRNLKALMEAIVKISGLQNE